MTTTDASAPGGPTRLLNPRRSAHATIRGYLYQTCLGVLRWLDLQPNEILLCEGDEDLDRFLLGGGSVSEQVKAYTGGLSLSDRAVLESLGNFLRSYVALRRRGETRSFVFTTTAHEKKRRNTGLDFDLLEAWKEGNRTKKVISSVRSLLKPKKNEKDSKETTEAIAWLDAEPDGWRGFMDAVEWSFDAPDLDAIRDRIKSRVALRDDTKLLSAEIFRDRLIARVLDASIQAQPQDRTLTSRILSDVIGTAERDLGEWAKTPEADRLRTVFDELKQVQRLLHDNTAKLPEKASPGKLLTAAYEVIPFDEAGRREELDFLKEWCDGDNLRSVLLLTGEGGSGKTRLMIEWCRHLRHQGWHAGFLRQDREADHLDSLLEGPAPRLVVLDYAETRLGVLEPMLRKIGLADEGQGPKLRLVLLARRRADWWDNLPHLGRQVEDLLLRSPEPCTITPLVPKDATDRIKAFRVATDGFAVQLDLKVPKDLHIPDLSEGKFDRVLYLHMAALATLRGERIETAESALEQTLDHEQLFWRNRVSDLGLDRSLTSLMNKAVEPAVAAVTLVGGAKTLQHAQALLDRVLKDLPLQPHHSTTVLELLCDLYAGPRGEDGRYIDPLQPDLIGEELVAKALNRDIGTLAKVLDSSEPEEWYSILTVLTRLAQRRPEHEKYLEIALQGRLETLADIALNVAMVTGDPIGVELAKQLPSGASPSLLFRLVDRCDEPYNRDSVPLREVALAATDLSLRFLRDYWKDPTEGQQQELARLAVNLGNRLSVLGHNQPAFAMTQEALERYKKLASSNPTYKPALASTLMNQGPILADLNREDDAIQTLEEAVTIFQELEKREHPKFSADLALSLVNLGAMKARKYPEEAIAALQQATEIYQRLSAEDPVFLISLAGSLLNLAGALSRLQQFESALQISSKSVDIWRALQKERPDAYSSDLASSLLNHGAILSMLRDHQGALHVTEEAVRIFRQLSDKRKSSFAKPLAKGLSNLGAIFLDLGNHKASAQALEESILIKQELDPDSIDLEFSTIADLHRLAQALLAIGNSIEALRCAESAIHLFIPYFQQFPRQLEQAMGPMVITYQAAAQSAGEEPDPDILCLIENLAPTAHKPHPPPH